MPDIRIQGAREHSLKNLTLTLPQQQLIVITGPSGSGKSSLAFDTLFAEGQRRYMESLSTTARQFLARLPRPEVDLIEGLAPAIALGQKRPLPNPRATVATTTEIYDYLRLLFATLGRPHDPETGELVEKRSLSDIVEEVAHWSLRSRIMILAPYQYESEENWEQLIARARRDGLMRLRLQGEILDLEESAQLQFGEDELPSVEVVIDRLILKPEEDKKEKGDQEDAKISSQTRLKAGLKDRLYDSMETALRLGKESLLVLVQFPDQEEASWEEVYFSTDFFNPRTGFRIGALTPQFFSFNTPQGACSRCHGTGREPEGEGEENSFTQTEGSVSFFNSSSICSLCHGKRLRSEVLAVTLSERTVSGEEKTWNIDQLLGLTIEEARQVVLRLNMSDQERLLLKEVLHAIEGRFRFLEEVGAAYLPLNRLSSTLSGGEHQRLLLARQIGSQLSGVLYVLDEPTIGLHPRDHAQLLQALLHLRDLGNSLIVVEHDREMMAAADYLLELGPGAGEKGGELLAAGSPQELMQHPDSITGAYLRGTVSLKKLLEQLEHKEQEEKKALTAISLTKIPSSQTTWLRLRDAKKHHLKNVTLELPLGHFIGISGVSGSGKSTLIHQLLYPALRQKLGHKVASISEESSELGTLEGWENLEQVMMIDQRPIGSSPRSNPATYLKIFDLLRDLFAALPAARMRGYDAGYFSFNKKGGRCEVCRGEGVKKVPMQFLADLFLPCEVCHGRRFRRETLELTFKGKSIADFLEMSIEEALNLLQSHPKIARPLKVLVEVGLGYLRLGQPANTLSGGESQRLKLAKELAKREQGKTLYLLDEPTTGLHITDIAKLMKLLFRLRNQGNTIVIIEHHPEVLAALDWLIDLGPGAGPEGGTIVAAGRPRDVALHPESMTGRFLS